MKKTTFQRCHTWTGLVGEADQEVRNIGKKFFVFEYVGGLVVTEEADTAQELCENTEWASWVCMKALNRKQALRYWDNAFSQWQAYSNGIVDFLGIVKIKHKDRDDYGDVDLKKRDTLRQWAKEMQKRYGITVEYAFE